VNKNVKRYDCELGNYLEGVLLSISFRATSIARIKHEFTCVSDLISTIKLTKFIRINGNVVRQVRRYQRRQDNYEKRAILSPREKTHSSEEYIAGV